MRKPGKLRWYQATYLGSDDVFEVHRFPAEKDPQRSPYPAITSMNWFREREYTENIFVDIEPLVCVLKMEAVRKVRTPDHVYSYHADPHFFHESLWAFYDAIGYDRKKKKWGVRPIPGPALTPAQLDEICTNLDADYANYSEIAVRA
jgi:hypothetical protein